MLPKTTRNYRLVWSRIHVKCLCMFSEAKEKKLEFRRNIFLTEFRRKCLFNWTRITCFNKDKKSLPFKSCPGAECEHNIEEPRHSRKHWKITCSFVAHQGITATCIAPYQVHVVWRVQTRRKRKRLLPYMTVFDFVGRSYGMFAHVHEEVTRCFTSLRKYPPKSHLVSVFKDY